MKSLEKMTLKEKWDIFPIILEKPNPNWGKIYTTIEQRLKTSFSDVLVRIHHIGSTSVPKLMAKPTIDVLMEIKDDTDIERFITRMNTLGYIHSHTTKNPLDMMFLKGYTSKGFQGQAEHIHVRHLGDHAELYFCEYLRNHPEVCKAYEALKRSLKETYEHHRDNYTNGKERFIKQHTKIARKELHHKYKKG